MALRESRATPPGSDSGTPRRRRHVDQIAQAVGEPARRTGQLAQLARPGRRTRRRRRARRGRRAGRRAGARRSTARCRRRVALRLDGGQPSACRLGPVVGVAHGQAGLGELCPRRLGGGRRLPPRRRARRRPGRLPRRGGPAGRRARRGSGRRPARRPPAGAPPCGWRTPRRPVSRHPRSAATSAATRCSHPSSCRSHSMPISSTSSGTAPTASRRRKSGSASIARRSLPSAAVGIRRGWRTNGLSSAGNVSGALVRWAKATANSMAERR